MAERSDHGEWIDLQAATEIESLKANAALKADREGWAAEIEAHERASAHADRPQAPVAPTAGRDAAARITGGGQQW